MSRRSRNNGLGSAISIIILLSIGVMYSQGWSGIAIFNTIVGGILLIVLVSLLYSSVSCALRVIGRIMRKNKHRRIDRLNQSLAPMAWDEFEYFVADWLRGKGYTNVSITEHYDLGVDIIANKDNLTWGVQVKHYSGLVGIDAVRQVVVALKKYKCDRAIVVTNSTFSRPVIELAKSQDCVLIDGSKLQD